MGEALVHSSYLPFCWERAIYFGSYGWACLGYTAQIEFIGKMTTRIVRCFARPSHIDKRGYLLPADCSDMRAARVKMTAAGDIGRVGYIPG